jgi:ABC-2 type transport system ATP-binding protein
MKSGGMEPQPKRSWTVMIGNTSTLEGASTARLDEVQDESLAAARSRAGELVIDIEHLHVSYGKVKAVRDVSLQVRDGEIFGLLGPNGAGKTTVLSTIEGLVKPESGDVRVLGLDAVRQTNQVKRLLGLSLQTTAFFDNLKVWEIVRLYAGMYQVFVTRSQAVDLLARFELVEKANALAKELSGGQQQRLALALAIVTQPQIVILDEPTTGLDPQARRDIWDIIRQIRAEGRTVLLTTHYMEEAQELCHRVGIIDRGELIALDTPGGLINKLRADSTITATIRLPEEDVSVLPGVTSAFYERDRLTVRTSNAQETMLGLQALAVQHRQMLTDLSVKQPDLEDVFISLTGRKIQ